MIYLDNAATTAPSGAALAAFNEAALCYGNPSSLHEEGVAARRLVSAARTAILTALGAPDPSSVIGGSRLIFTSGGTEANNLAITGALNAKKKRGRLVISDGEHASAARCADRAEADGYEVTRIPTRGGALDLDALKAACEGGAASVVSLMLVSNETGALHDVAAAFTIARALSPNAFLHTDAVQAFCKVPFTVRSLGADAVSISAHKIRGLKGTGALYVSSEALRAKKLSPLIVGGGQEGALRSGTENVPGIAAFGAAAAEASAGRAEAYANASALLDRLRERCAEFDGRIVEPEKRSPFIAALTLPRVRSEVMLHALSQKGIAVSSGSACSSNAKRAQPSAALLAFGLNAEEADRTIRVSFGDTTMMNDIDALCDALRELVPSLQA